MSESTHEIRERLERLSSDIHAEREPQLLRGTIKNLRKTRTTHDFMFTQADRNKMGAGAVIAAAEGLGGLAVGLAGSAMDTSEEADLLEFELNGKPIRAWVWWSVFQDGDDVEIVAEPMGDVWQAYGIRRPADKILALHPHCSRGRYAHYKASLKWYLIGFSFVFSLLLIFTIINMIVKNDNDAGTLLFLIAVGLFGGGGIYGIIAWRVSRKFMGFVELAERIFTVFGWKDVKNIDLPAITKKNKRPGDPAALGTLFFRY
jgi:hypothetical protein